MAHAAVKILDGLGDKPLTIDKADKFLDFLSDLAGDSVENDTSLQKVIKNIYPMFAFYHFSNIKRGNWGAVRPLFSTSTIIISSLCASFPAAVFEGVLNEKKIIDCIF